MLVLNVAVTLLSFCCFPGFFLLFVLHEIERKLHLSALALFLSATQI